MTKEERLDLLRKQWKEAKTALDRKIILMRVAWLKGQSTIKSY